MANGQILIVDNLQIVHDVLNKILTKYGYQAVNAYDGATAVDLVRKLGLKIVICDLKMPGMDGKETMLRLRDLDPEIAIIVLTAYEDEFTQDEYVSLNIFDYIVKPPKIPRLLSSIRRAELLIDAGEKVETIRTALQLVTDWSFSRNQVIRNLVNELHSIAWAGTNVVIYGESGTGKTVLAQAIHHLSRRARGPFVKLDIGSISDNVAESELFGYKRGAFTGADRDKAGMFSVAHKGTLFLDEIQNMSPHVQTKLLNAVEQRVVRPVGGTTEAVPADFRLVSATNADLPLLIKQDKFRADLFYRIQESSIRIPPLRDRFEDIPSIAAKIVDQTADAMEIPAPIISSDSMNLLQGYSWPGNIRELKNVLRHALAICDGETILPSHLSEITADIVRIPSLKSAEPLTLMEIERDAIQRSLIRAGGNKVRAAKELAIDYKTLLNKIKRYQLMI